MMTRCMHTLGDLGRAVAGLDEDISALGSKCSCDSSCKSLDAVQQSSSAFNTKLQLLVGESLLHQRARSYP